MERGEGQQGQEQKLEELEKKLERISSEVDQVKERLSRLEMDMRKGQLELAELKRAFMGWVESFSLTVSTLRGGIKELKREVALKRAREED